MIGERTGNRPAMTAFAREDQRLHFEILSGAIVLSWLPHQRLDPVVRQKSIPGFDFKLKVPMKNCQCDWETDAHSGWKVQWRQIANVRQPFSCAQKVVVEEQSLRGLCTLSELK